MEKVHSRRRVPGFGIATVTEVKYDEELECEIYVCVNEFGLIANFGAAIFGIWPIVA